MSKSNIPYTIKELFPDNNFTETGLEVKKRVADMHSVTDVSAIKLIHKKKIISDNKLIESYSPSPDDTIFVYISKSTKSPSSSSNITPASSNPDLSPVTSQPDISPSPGIPPVVPQPDVPPTISSTPNPPPPENPTNNVIPPPAETDLFKDPLDVSNLQPKLPSMTSGPSLKIPGFPDNFDFHRPQMQTNPSKVSTGPHQHDLSFPGMPTFDPSVPSPGTLNPPSGNLTPPPVPENFSPQIPADFNPSIPSNLTPPPIPEDFNPSIPGNLTPPPVPDNFSPQIPENFNPSVPDMINQSPPIPQQNAPSEENIKNLTEMGFTKEQATDALLMVGNNVEAAIDLLINQSQVQSQPQQPTPPAPTPQIPQYETPTPPPAQPPEQPPTQPPEQPQPTSNPEPSNETNENANNNTEENAENQSNESFQNEEADISHDEDFSNFSNIPEYTATTDEPTEPTINITEDTSFAPPPVQAPFSGPNYASFVPRSTPVASNDTYSNLPSSLANYSAPQPISSSITQVAPPEHRRLTDIMHSMMGKNQMGMPSMASPGSLAMFHTMHGSEMGMESLMSEHGFGSQPISSPSSNYGAMASSVQSSFAGGGNSGLGGMSGIGGMGGGSGMGGFSQPKSNPLLDSLPANEKSDIETLMREFPNYQAQEIIGIYNACDKNMDNTRGCLKAG